MFDKYYFWLKMKFKIRGVPYTIKQNNEGKFGIEWEENGKIINSVLYKYDEIQACEPDDYKIFFHMI